MSDDRPVEGHQGQRSLALDLWLALLAGNHVWSDGVTHPGLRDRNAAAIALAGVATTFSTIWVAISGRFDVSHVLHDSGRRQVLVAVGLVASAFAAALVVHYARILIGRDPKLTGFWPSLIWRLAASLAMVIALAGALPRAHPIGAIPLGVLAGADASLTLWAVGSRPRPIPWVKRFALGPLHFGVLGGLLATAVFATDRPAVRTIGSLYAAMWVGLVTVVVTVVVLDRLAAAADHDHEQQRAEIVASERAHRAHWLHDDVLSEVRLASLRISSGSATSEDVNAELLDLDHRLRLRQLDDVIRTGATYVYEVLQPHLRRAQNLHVRLDRVPVHDVTRLRIEEEPARLLNRAMSLLISNAVNAGATRLAVDLSLVGDRLELQLTDDAGGFDLAEIPAGRGLSSLIGELGPGAVRRLDSSGGSTMVVAVPLAGARDARSRRDAPCSDPSCHRSDSPHAVDPNRPNQSTREVTT